MRLFGKHCVDERLKVAPFTIHSLYVQEGADVHQMLSAARKADIPCYRLAARPFFKRTGGKPCQGIMAVAEDFRYQDFRDLLDNEETPYVFLFLSELTDPQNLGNILRTAACLGGFALVLPRHRSVPVNETVLKVASGGENYVPVAQVSNLASAIKEAKDRGYGIAGTIPEGGEYPYRIRLPWPLGLVFGSEGEGIRQGISRLFDLTLSLPMGGRALSYNVATAAALFCYEVARQKTIYGQDSDEEKEKV
jgi:23S rRNA (guanosine2251-2'-O)-methyltransferase